jgi:ketosteroid isomerase-like protein
MSREVISTVALQFCTPRRPSCCPDAPIIVGRKAIRDFWASVIPLRATLTTLDLETSQDIAWETGEALLGIGAGGVAIRYVVIRRKGQDGSWRLHRDIWNRLLWQ